MERKEIYGGFCARCDFYDNKTVECAMGFEIVNIGNDKRDEFEPKDTCDVYEMWLDCDAEEEREGW